jgi:hypothetical protein
MQLSRDGLIKETAQIACGMVNAVIDPIDGCRRVWRMSSATNHQYLPEVSGFVGVVAQWDEYPEYRDDLVNDGLDVARAFLERYPFDGQSARASGP